ncbi:MAG: X2-like carbohydrate binding domain-containing protein [Christensenellaceae bacterium]|jgi:hypothetical protein
MRRGKHFLAILMVILLFIMMLPTSASAANFDYDVVDVKSGAVINNYASFDDAYTALGFAITAGTGKPHDYAIVITSDAPNQTVTLSSVNAPNAVIIANGVSLTFEGACSLYRVPIMLGGATASIDSATDTSLHCAWVNKPYFSTDNSPAAMMLSSGIISWGTNDAATGEAAAGVDLSSADAFTFLQHIIVVSDGGNAANQYVFSSGEATLPADFDLRKKESFVIEADATVSLAANVTFALTASASVTNKGAVSLGDGASLNIGAACNITNEGTIDGGGATSTVSIASGGYFENTGTVAITGNVENEGALCVKNDFSVEGAVANGGEIFVFESASFDYTTLTGDPVESIDDDMSIASIFGQTVQAGNEAGTLEDPKKISLSVSNAVDALVETDIVLSSENAFFLLYDSASFENSATIPFALSVGANNIYCEVWAEAESAVTFYHIEITRADKKDAFITPVSGIYDKKAKNDIVVTVTPNDYTLTSLRMDGATSPLVLGTHYTLTDNVVTFTKAWMDTLALDTYDILFQMDGGATPKFALTVIDNSGTLFTIKASAGAGGTISPHWRCYCRKRRQQSLYVHSG